MTLFRDLTPSQQVDRYAFGPDFTREPDMTDTQPDTEEADDGDRG